MNPFDFFLNPKPATLEVLLDAILIQSAVLAVLFFLSRLSAARQHLLLSASVLMVLAVTVVSPLVPSRSLGILPFVEAGLPAWRVGGVEAGGPAGAEAVRPERGEREAAVSGAGSGAVDREAGVTGGEGPSGGGRRNWAGLAGLVWVLGTLLLLVRLVWGVFRSWRLSARARAPAGERPRSLFGGALRAVGLGPGVALAESDELRIPMVFGFLRPRVILPAAAAGWPEARLRAVLIHESAHVRRRDLVFQVLAKLCCAFFWFIPQSWVVERKLFLASEKAADDQVIDREVAPSDYAEHLMEASVELGTARNPVWATAAMAEGTAFKDRILSILDPNIGRGEPTMSHRSAVLVSTVFMLVPFLVFNPWSPASVEDSQRAAAAPATPERTADSAVPFVQEQGVRSDLNTLLAMLGMSDAGMREHAATALGQAGDGRAVLPLVDVVLHDRVASVREHAATALGQLGDARAVRPLMDAILHDRAASVREHAAAALGQLGDPEAVMALVDVVLKDAVAAVREHAGTALGQLRDARALEPLLDAMRHDPDPAVREHAAVAIGQLGDSRAFDHLLDVMYGGDEDAVRAHAAYALGLLGDRRALEHLVPALSDESAVMRRNAAMGLGELGDPRALDALMQAQRDPDEQVRGFAAEAIRKIRR